MPSASQPFNKVELVECFPRSLSSDSFVAMSTSGQPSPFASYCYQVFLCFRGPDVRHNFLECLHRRLKSYGIDAFKDSEGIRTGEPIMEKLLKTIDDAEICVPILSKDFASSSSCLKEVEQMVAYKRTILPIFYGVKPHVVGYQLESYERSFRNRIRRIPPKILNKWREALLEVSKVSGEELPDIENGYQDLIDRVVDRLRELLRLDHQDLPKHYVSIDHHVQEVLRELDIGYDEHERLLKAQCLTEKRVVVISGRRGIGKTTLAKAVYNSIRPLFRISGSCFLLAIGEKVAPGILLSLQKKLICDLQGSCQQLESLEEGVEFIARKFRNKPVLLVLDDVEYFQHIERLLGGLDWLGPGSRVLLTSCRRDLINQFKGHDRQVLKHKMERWPHDKAEILFYTHAFQSDYPEEGFTDIARGITERLHGIPRHIELVGSCLYGKDDRHRRGLWQEMWEMLEVEPIGDVKKFVRPSRRNLDKNTNHIFLDIACLFNRMDRTIPLHLWKACDKYPNWAIYNLWSLHWLDCGENNALQMPEDMVIQGKRKVRDEGSHPLKRSRIWDLDDVERTLDHVKARDGKKVEALCLADDIPLPVRFSYPQLCFLTELRVLRLSRAGLYGNLPKIVHGQNRPSRKTVLQELRWLSWKGCVNVSLLRTLHAERLLILDLSSSGVSFAESMECWQKIFKGFKRLKVLDLSGCSGVSRIFPLPSSLEQLILDHCGSPFPRGGGSVCGLHNLVFLNLRHCQLGDKLPKDLLQLKALTELLVDGTGIVELPKDLMKQLEVLSANDCKNLEHIPQFEESSRMRVMSFKGCEKVCEIPDSIKNLVCLEELDLSETMIKEIPASFRELQKLRVLRMRMTFLEQVPRFVNEMEKLKDKDFAGCRSMKGGTFDR